MSYLPTVLIATGTSLRRDESVRSFPINHVSTVPNGRVSRQCPYPQGASSPAYAADLLVDGSSPRRVLGRCADSPLAEAAQVGCPGFGPPSIRGHTLFSPRSPLQRGCDVAKVLAKCGTSAETVVKTPGLSSPCTMQ